MRRKFYFTFQWQSSTGIEIRSGDFATDSKISVELLELIASKIGAPSKRFAVLCFFELEE